MFPFQFSWIDGFFLVAYDGNDEETKPGDDGSDFPKLKFRAIRFYNVKIVFTF